MDEFREEKSKTQIKNEAHQLQKIGEQLLTLSPDQLAKMDIPNELKDAILHAKSIRSNQAKRRQIQYIGALMRTIDPEAVLTAISLVESGLSLNTKEPASKHKTWAQDLIRGDNEVFQVIVETYPNVDRQKLRQLILKAQKSQESPQAAKSLKLLTRYIDTLSHF